MHNGQAPACFGGQLLHRFLMRLSCRIHPPLIVRPLFRYQIQCADLLLHNKEITMKTWFKPEISETEAGMEVTSYLPAELDRA